MRRTRRWVLALRSVSSFVFLIELVAFFVATSCLPSPSTPPSSPRCLPFSSSAHLLSSPDDPASLALVASNLSGRHLAAIIRL